MPVARIKTGADPTVAFVVAVNVAVLESVLPVSTDGLNATVTPAGSVSALNVSASARPCWRVIVTTVLAIWPGNTTTTCGKTTVTVPGRGWSASVAPLAPLQAASDTDNRIRSAWQPGCARELRAAIIDSLDWQEVGVEHGPHTSPLPAVAQPALAP